jgi:hypothetical protein
MNCAVIKDNVVVNIIVAELTDPPPEGCTLVEIPFCDIGYTWDGTRFNPPQPSQELKITEPIEAD